jgi:hypothetical protein
MSDPKSHGQMMNYLVRNSEDKKRMREYFETNQITTASNINRPREPKLTQIFQDFNERNPLADGGMLVKPGFGGVRQGYNGRGGPRPNTGGDRSKYITYKKKPPTKKQLEITEKVYSKKYGKTGIDLWESLKQFERSNIRQGKTTGETGGVGKLKKNQLSKEDFIKLVNANRDKTYNEFVKVLENYRTKDNKPFTKPIIADRLSAYGMTRVFKKEPSKKDPTKKAETEKKRVGFLKETDPTGAKGTKKVNYHHIRQIAGGVPLTTDDVMLINQKINSQLGGETNKALNRISAAIQKNNRLALEAMNAKNEGAALDYMKRVDDLNAQAEKIVNSAIDKLPKKYKGYVGFNQFTLPRDEYGLPISNEPMLIRKVGGMPVSKDAIDLTNLNLKQEQEFRKIVKQQAERGKIGKIDVSEILKDKTRGEAGFVDLDLFKDIGKGAGAVLKAVPTPAGTVGLTAGFGVDPTSAIDRASIAAEAAFAPALVQQAAKFSPAVQRVLNLGLSPQMALRAARIASPIGIASLGAEGAYQLGKFTKDRIKQLREMSPEDREELRRKGDEFAFSEFAAAGGGLAKQAGDRSGAMLRSMNPDSQGLSGLLKRGKKI